jgi:hypothetical protein
MLGSSSVVAQLAIGRKGLAPQGSNQILFRKLYKDFYDGWGI